MPELNLTQLKTMPNWNSKQIPDNNTFEKKLKDILLGQVFAQDIPGSWGESTPLNDVLGVNKGDADNLSFYDEKNRKFIRQIKTRQFIERQKNDSNKERDNVYWRTIAEKSIIKIILRKLQCRGAN